MKELHKCSFRVKEIEEYREWISKNKHVPMLRKLGGTLKYLEEVRRGEWIFELIIDTDNPDHKKIPLISEDAGFHIQITTLPVIENLDARDTLDKLKQAIAV
tara:strand:+ start:581 stop:886 length:306 start_codon:yes stop_codon:yes gene_type:complete